MLDKQIYKSLIDKEDDSLVYTPTIVVNGNSKSIKNKIIDNLKKADRVDIAVSYSVWSGLQLIYPYLKKFDNRSRFIVTLDGMITDPQSLEYLIKLRMETKVHQPLTVDDGFHLKSYFFEFENTNTLLIGSSNISARAFGLSQEMMVELTASKNGQIILDYKLNFQNIWQAKGCSFITEEIILSYKKRFFQRKRQNKEIEQTLLLLQKIEPNYMQWLALLQLSKLREYSSKGLIIAATGTGKTYLSAFDVQAFGAKKVLFLVHNRSIIRTAKKTYKNIFPKRSILELTTKNQKELYHHDIVFSTDKTAYKVFIQGGFKQSHFDYVIFDEAHRIGEKTLYAKIISYLKPDFMLGMTATPERTDKPRYLFETFDLMPFL